MAKRKFHMKQASLQGKKWRALSFQDQIGNETILPDPIVSNVCGDEIDYGPLFAYCFRRFGYPSRGWDARKELVQYYLTTPHPDLVLLITPHVSNATVIALRFLVERDTAHQKITAYAQRDRDAWLRRAFYWAETEGLPDWMQEWVDIYNTEYRKVFLNAPLANHWWQAVGFFNHLQIWKEGTRQHELCDRIVEFRKHLTSLYSQVDPYPAYYYRPSELQKWNEDDPLKPFALAAIEALEDLRTPVRIRDASIDAFGELDSERAIIKPAACAGFASGALGTDAPAEFAELHSLILKLGKGSAKRGIKLAMSRLSAG